MTQFSPCRSCKGQVRWARTAATGKAMPLEEDDERGNVILDGHGRAHAFRDHDAAVAAGEADPDTFGLVTTTFVSHHAVCPEGQAWRRKKREKPAAPVQESLL